MLLQNCRARTDEQLRVLYVGMTRAKSALYIHCDKGVFERFSAEGVRYSFDGYDYGEASEMLIQLSHKDVYLGYFKNENRQNVIERLHSGMRLGMQGNDLFIQSRDGRAVSVARFSKAFAKQFDRWTRAGFQPVEIVIQHILWWKGEGDEEETLIILPTIRLRRGVDSRGS